MGYRRKIKYEIDSNGCWNCISHKANNFGYPKAVVYGKMDHIHRHIYELFIGIISPGKVIRHMCDNPICINPDHLISGTHYDNVKDRVNRDRSAKGEKNGRSKLTADQVLEIFKNTKTSKHELSRIYKVDPKVIRDIKSGITWKCVTGL